MKSEESGMRVESVNVGTPEILEWQGREFRTSIRKSPVGRPVRVGSQGIIGDEQADLRVHGGPDKAVYLYPAEHAPFWSEVLGQEVGPGGLGENLTTRGIEEADLAVGDELEIGTTLLQVSQPRLPCVKLAARYRRADLPKIFTREERPGAYLRVLRDGRITPGDSIRIARRAPERWSVPDLFRILTGTETAPGVAARLAGLATLGRRSRSRLQEVTGFEGEIRDATPDEIAVLTGLLAEAGLPRDGFPDDTPIVLVAEDGSGLLGGVALERHGASALLRSLVVRPEARGRDLGRALTRAALARAWGSEANAVALLTETAPGFFAGMGFDEVARSDLPAELGASRELRGVCPESARVFLSRRSSGAVPASIPGS